MSDLDSVKKGTQPGILCPECRQLLDAFGEAVHEVVMLHEKHLLAVAANELDPHRFDLLIHAANERKQDAKYAYVQHREGNRCSTKNETDRDRT